MTRVLMARLDEYLALRHGQGYALAVQETLLRSFVRFAGRVDHRGPLSVDLAVRWTKTSPSCDPEYLATRLSIVRGFARYLATTQPGTEIPPIGLLSRLPQLPLPPQPIPQTPLAARIEEYLALRQRLGYRLVSQAKFLRSFARFAAREGHQGPLTVDLATRWALSTRSRSPDQPAWRLRVVRVFARHLIAFEPDTEVPPADLVHRSWRRKPPHIYSDAEIDALLRGAASLRPRHGLRRHTFVALFSLLASTGMRVSEALDLRCRDADLRRGVLTIRGAKFGKSRLVPLHPSAVGPLRRYARLRDRCAHAPRSKFFFRTDHAGHLKAGAVDATFATLRRHLGWTEEGRARRPRIHDLRHTFAVRRLLRWYQEGVEIDRKMLHLVTYLGHVDVSGTYWYLTAVPELMALAAQRFEQSSHHRKERGS